MWPGAPSQPFYGLSLPKFTRAPTVAVLSLLRFQSRLKLDLIVKCNSDGEKMLKRLVIPGGKRTFFMLLLVVALLSGSIFAYNYFNSQNKQAPSSPATQKAGSIEPGPVSTEVDAEKANTAPKEREGGKMNQPTLPIISSFALIK